MKKFTFLFLALCFLLGTAIAQNVDKKWAIGLGPGIYDNLNKNKIRFMTEVYLSRYLSPSFDLMLKNNTGFYNEGIDFFNQSLDLRYKFYDGTIISKKSAIQPYLYGGVGYLLDNKSGGVNLDAGIGTKITLTPNTSLFLEAGYMSGINGDRVINNVTQNVKDDMLKVSGIIEFSFGKAKDSDGDGVADKMDECLNTPAGVLVNNKGCPRDRDGDGVPDYKDDCPDEAGSLQNNGCPDKDGDGIIDKNDDCPDVAGLAKFQGCPGTDSDNVIDSQDKSPGGKGSIDNEGSPDEQTLQASKIYSNIDSITRREQVTFIQQVDKLNNEFNSYFVIIGSFSQLGNAKNYRETLLKEGFSPIILYSVTGYYRVCINAYNNKQAARTLIGQVRHEFPKYSDIWLLVKE